MILETEMIDSYHDMLEEDCAHCGDPMFFGDFIAWEPEPIIGPNAVVAVHDYCAVKDGYGLRNF